MSSFTGPTGTSLATGLPRLVIRTGSRLDWTSSITARHLVLNSPAGMVFIGDSLWLWSYYHGRIGIARGKGNLGDETAAGKGERRNAPLALKGLRAAGL